MDRVERELNILVKKQSLKNALVYYILLYVSHLKLGHKRDETDAERMG